MSLMQVSIDGFERASYAAAKCHIPSRVIPCHPVYPTCATMLQYVCRDGAVRCLLPRQPSFLGSIL